MGAVFEGGLIPRRTVCNHLLFMDDLLYSRNENKLDSLVQTIGIFHKDIEMEFGIEKSAMLVIEKGKTVKSVGMELADG